MTSAMAGKIVVLVSMTKVPLDCLHAASRARARNAKFSQDVIALPMALALPLKRNGNTLPFYGQDSGTLNGEPSGNAQGTFS